MATSRAMRSAGVNWAEEGASRGQGSRRVQTGAFLEPPGQHGQSREELQGGWGQRGGHSVCGVKSPAWPRTGMG